MDFYKIIVEHCPNTGLYVGYVPELPGLHTQAASLDELKQNLKEVTAMLLTQRSFC